MTIFIGLMIKNKINKSILRKSASVVIPLLLWEALAKLVNSKMLLASPLTVLKTLFTLIFEKTFFETVLFSVARITSGFLLGFIAGCVLAALSGKSRLVETLLRPYVVTAKTVPVASFIILSLIWFSYTGLTVFISFLITFPVIYLNFLQGIKSTDKNMKELAKVYNVNLKRKLLYIYFPSVKPYLLASCGVSVGMAWKAGVAAEVIGVVGNSIGERLYDAKIYFQNAELLSWTVVIIVLSVLEEKLFCAILKFLFSRMEKL